MTLAPHDSQQPNHTEQLPDTSRTQEIPAASGPTAPPPPPAPSHPAGQPSGAASPRRGRGLAQTAGVALLAAVLASGGTYALTQANESDTSTPTATTQQNSDSGTSPTVVQGNAAAPDWSAVAKAVSPSVVSIQLAQGAGSGVVLDKSGHILTNNHVVEGAPGSGGIQVTLADGRTYDASIVGTDPSTDLAVIKLSAAPDDLTPITLADSDQLAVGDPVMAIGNPLGLSGTVTTGIISALDRPVSTGSSNDSPPARVPRNRSSPTRSRRRPRSTRATRAVPSSARRASSSGSTAPSRSLAAVAPARAATSASASRSPSTRPSRSRTSSSPMGRPSTPSSGSAHATPLPRTALPSALAPRSPS